MSSQMFSSPGKTAKQAASAQGDVTQGYINQEKDYIDKKQNEERAAITGLGDNQYFKAAGMMKPDAYRVDPNNTTAFSAPPPPQAVMGTGAPRPIPPGVFQPPVQPPGGFPQAAPMAPRPAPPQVTPRPGAGA